MFYYRYSIKLREDRNGTRLPWHRWVARMTSKDFYHWSKPIIFDGGELEINYRTGAAGYVRVELVNEDGYVIPGFHADMCESIVRNEISRIVRWRSDVYEDYDLHRLSGMPVRLRFYLKDADVFSFKFHSAQ